MAEKKPDNIVYNEESEKYDAFLKPYGTNLAAPVIHSIDTVAWKNNNIQTANKLFNAEYEELKHQYQQLMERFQYNEIIYASRFSFEPLVGETYFLYKDKNDAYFLSLISPEECSFNYVGTFRLNSDKTWERLNQDL
ncbi:MAG: DUF2452 domain-containing protein [Flavobacteriaceae bacterium]|nr:DUF2452 domain-containing protein [Flavobacteriaceae bacterium]